MSLLNRGAIYIHSHSIMSQSVEHDLDISLFAVFAWLFVFPRSDCY